MKPLRFPALWEPTAKKIHNFLDANDAAISRIETGVICVVDSNRQPLTDWMDDDFKILFDRIDNVEIRWPHNWDGSVEMGIDDHWFRDREQESQGKVCFFLQENFVVLPNGTRPSVVPTLTAAANWVTSASFQHLNFLALKNAVR